MAHDRCWQALRHSTLSQAKGSCSRCRGCRERIPRTSWTTPSCKVCPQLVFRPGLIAGALGRRHPAPVHARRPEFSAAVLPRQGPQQGTFTPPTGIRGTFLLMHARTHQTEEHAGRFCLLEDSLRDESHPAVKRLADAANTRIEKICDVNGTSCLFCLCQLVQRALWTFFSRANDMLLQRR